MMTDTQQNDGPPFLADLADDAVMTGTILAKPLKGKDVISQVIRSIASCYDLLGSTDAAATDIATDQKTG
jgi:hypothetical protein